MKKMTAEETEITVLQPRMKTIIKRAVLAVVALVVLIAAVVYLTLGWYTKMTGITYTEFNVARWDFTANYQIDSFDVNVYEYSTIDGDDENIAAPGTAGTLELRLGADDSDTDVHYLVQLDKSTMSEEFQKRIYFYYDNNGVREEFIFGSSAIEGEIPAHSSAVVTLYWEWVYDYDEYLQKQDMDEFRTLALQIGCDYADDYDAMGTDYSEIKTVIDVTDTIPSGKSSLLKNLYKAHYVKDKPDYSELETLIISRVLEANMDYNSAVFALSSGINPLEAMMNQTEAGLSSVTDAKYAAACRMASQTGSLADRYSALITQNILEFPNDMLDDLSIYLFGKTTAADLVETNKVRTLLTEASDLFAGTATEDSPGGNNLIFRALFRIAQMDKTLVLNTLNYFDEYNQKVHTFTDKYYKAVSAANGNEIYSSATVAAMKVLSDGTYDEGLQGFAATLSEDSFATPAAYLEAYRSYYGYSTVLSMTGEFVAEREEFDDYDTEIGGNPGYYRQFMNAKVYIIGEQIVPTEVTG